MSTTSITSYEEAVASHEWRVPERYNIAAGRLRQAPGRQARDDPRALRRDRPRGAVGRAAGALEPVRQRAARARRREGRPRGDAAAADARDRGRVLRHLEVRRDPALDVGALRRRRHPPPRQRLAGQGARHQRGQQGPGRPVAGRARPRARRRAAGRPATRRSSARTRSPTTRRSSTTRRARPGWPRASCTRTATCSRTRSSSTATTCATASASTAWASGRGRRASRRCSGRGASARSSSSTSARVASIRTSSSTSSPAMRPPNVFTTPTAMRSMMAIADAGTRYPQKFRIVCWPASR